MKKSIVLLALTAATLGGCGASSDQASLPPVSGGKSATVVLESLSSSMLTAAASRPSGTLGVFVSLFLAQRRFLPTQSATLGIAEILHIIQGQEEPLNDETFALLQTLGDALSVNIVDHLNRSPDRVAALNLYVESLSNIVTNAKKRSEELDAALEGISAQKKAERATVSQITKEQKAAVKAKDFSLAGTKEKELIEAQTALSATTSKETQTESSLKKLTEFLTLAEKRLAAIEKNREILLSGLQVTDPQGLEDLGLVRETQRRSIF